MAGRSCHAVTTPGQRIEFWQSTCCAHSVVRARLDATPCNIGEAHCAVKLPFTRVPVQQRAEEAFRIFYLSAHFIDQQLAGPRTSCWFAGEQLQQHNAKRERVCFLRNLRIHAEDAKVGRSIKALGSESWV